MPPAQSTDEKRLARLNYQNILTHVNHSVGQAAGETDVGKARANLSTASQFLEHAKLFLDLIEGETSGKPT